MRTTASGAGILAPGGEERSEARTAIDERPIDRRIADLYGELLGIEAVDVDADFFSLGGQSLRAMQLLAAINEAFSTELQFGDLIDEATPRALARRIGRLQTSGEPQPALERCEHGAAPSITRGQLLFWRLGGRQELATYFNLRQAFMLHGPLDTQALQAALQALVDRHDILRTHFLPVDGRTSDDAELIVSARRAVAFSIVAAPIDAAADPAAFVCTQLRGEIEQPFDLLSEPLIRFRLIRFSPTRHAFMVTMHHLITDAWSFNVLRRDLQLLYRAHTLRQPDALPELPFRYADYAHWNRRLHQSDSYRQQRGYWDELFSSLGPIRGGPGSGGPGSVGDGADRAPGTRYADLSITAADLARLTHCSAVHHTTPYVLLQVLMHLALYHTFRGQERMLVLSPAAERHRPELQNCIGLYITIVGVLSMRSATTTLGQFIARLKRNVHEALEHAESRQFALYDLAKHRATDFPLFVYNYFVLPNDTGWALTDLQVEPLMPPDDERPFVTTLELYHARGPTGLWGQLKYDGVQVGDRAGRRFATEYRRILDAVLSCTDDDTPVAAFIER